MSRPPAPPQMGSTDKFHGDKTKKALPLNCLRGTSTITAAWLPLWELICSPEACYNKFHWPFIHLVDSLATCVTKLPHSASPSQSWELTPRHPARVRPALHRLFYPWAPSSLHCTFSSLISKMTQLLCNGIDSLHQLTFLGDSFSNSVLRLPSKWQWLNTFLFFGHWGLFLLPKDNGIASSCSSSMLICKMLNFPHKFDLS